MPLNDQTVMLRGRKQYKLNWSANTLFTVGFNGKGLWTNGFPPKGMLGSGNRPQQRILSRFPET